MKNRYLTHSHISEKKFREVLRYFSKDFTADQTADLTHISRVTINRLYTQLRLRIAELLGGKGKLGGEVEGDESYVECTPGRCIRIDTFHLLSTDSGQKNILKNKKLPIWQRSFLI